MEILTSSRLGLVVRSATERKKTQMKSRDDTPPLVTASQTLESYSQEFWQRQMSNVEEHASSSAQSNPMDVFKPQAGQLPLARIKKVMKNSDDEVKVSRAGLDTFFRMTEPS